MSLLKASKGSFQNYNLYKEHCYSKKIPLNYDINKERSVVFNDHTYAKKNKRLEIDDSVFYCNEILSENDLLLSCINDTIVKNAANVRSHKKHNCIKSTECHNSKSVSFLYKKRKRKSAPIILLSKTEGNCKSQDYEPDKNSRSDCSNGVHDIEKDISEKISHNDRLNYVQNLDNKIKKTSQNQFTITIKNIKNKNLNKSTEPVCINSKEKEILNKDHQNSRLISVNLQNGYLIDLSNTKKKICDCSNGESILHRINLEKHRKHVSANDVHNISKKKVVKHAKTSCLNIVHNSKNKILSDKTQNDSYKVSIFKKNLFQRSSTYQQGYVNDLYSPRYEHQKNNASNSSKDSNHWKKTQNNDIDCLPNIRKGSADKHHQINYLNLNGLSNIRKNGLRTHPNQQIKNSCDINDSIRQAVLHTKSIAKEVVLVDTLNFEESLYSDGAPTEDPLEIYDPLSIDDRNILSASDGINDKTAFDDPLSTISSYTDTTITTKPQNRLLTNNLLTILDTLNTKDMDTLESSMGIKIEKNNLDEDFKEEPPNIIDSFNVNDAIRSQPAERIRNERYSSDTVLENDPPLIVDHCKTKDMVALKSSAEIKIEGNISDSVDTEDTIYLESFEDIRDEKCRLDAVFENKPSPAVVPSSTKDMIPLKSAAEIKVEENRSVEISASHPSAITDSCSADDTASFKSLEKIKKGFNLLELRVLAVRCPSKIENKNSQRQRTECVEKNNSIAIQCKKCHGEKMKVKKYNDYRCSVCANSNVCLLCVNCNRHFDTLKNLRAHALNMLEHRKDKKYLKEIESLWKIVRKCQMCGKKFANSSILENHQRFCNLFKCFNCSARFFNIKLLENHVVDTHKNCQSYRCIICRKKYKKKYNWLQHISNCYTLPLLKTCRKCHKYFETIELLDKHKKICKPNIKKYKCLTCQTQFEEKNPYVWHVKHICQNHLQCNYCIFKADNGVELVDHQKTCRSKPNTCIKD